MYFLQLCSSRSGCKGVFYIAGVRAVKHRGTTTKHFVRGSRGCRFDSQAGELDFLDSEKLGETVYGACRCMLIVQWQTQPNASVAQVIERAVFMRHWS